MIYDESLIRSDGEAFAERILRMQLAALKEHVKRRSEESVYVPLFQFMDTAVQQITERLTRLQNESKQASLLIIILPPDDLVLPGFKRLVNHNYQWETISRFLSVVGTPLRLLKTTQDEGLVWYQICVPNELENVLILDASYPIRELVKLDSTITDATPTDALQIKRFDAVTVHQMQHSSGRSSMTDNFNQPWSQDRTVSREILEVIRSTPEDKTILIFTFKHRQGAVNIPEKLFRDLSYAGIDTSAKTPEGKDRINILTWGDETSLNRYAHCEVVILAGLLHLPRLEVGSKIIGQQDCMTAPASHGQVEAIIDSEMAHSVYQAISRGACRIVENGQAKAMSVYLFHRKSNLQQTLQGIMPGLQWKSWLPTCKSENATQSQTDILAMQIVAHLQKQPEERFSVTTREIRQALGIDSTIDKYRKAFDRAVEKVCQAGLWVRHGQALMRGGMVFC